ncbi:hypothetical protein [Bradyrhizobium japonicum]|nr:hypothetical protein [Bradyrhizobium japonicum]
MRQSDCHDADFGINFIGASHAEIEFEKLVEDPWPAAMTIRWHRANK